MSIARDTPSELVQATPSSSSFCPLKEIIYTLSFLKIKSFISLTQINDCIYILIDDDKVLYESSYILHIS